MKKMLLLCLLASAGLTAQNNPTRGKAEQGEAKPASDFFPKQKAQILVVGTFHFDYPGLDVHKTSDDNKIDVLREPKKSEVSELVAYIKKFKPTKIVLEAMPEWKAGEKLARYKKGEFRNERDERYQLGLRIATEMNLDTVYSIDAIPFDDELSKQNPAYFEKFFDGFDFKTDDPYAAKIFEWYNYEESLLPKTNLLQYFKRFNSRESHQLTYGAYLVGDFKLDDTRGADILSIWWYNRNLRIFRKVQQITTPQDRILMIYGNGHAAVLRQLFECSPEYQFVEFDSLK
ncbi:DUF5694 domain-containing protein [Flavobacterium sp.]|uniref:DUF5694 domain-containing protein n=1 Tax=Flavobacterium sp. TaxID=239 RepID=UPI0039E3E4EB